MCRRWRDIAPDSVPTRTRPTRTPPDSTAAAALVVGGFFGDGDVVGVALLAAGGGDLHEPAPLRSAFERGGTGVAHAAAQPADQLVDDVAQRAGVGDPALDAFGHQLLGGRADARALPLAYRSAPRPCIAPIEPMPR